MKRYINKLCLTAGVSFLSLAPFGCTGDFEEFNSNPTGATEQQVQNDFNHIGGNFATMQTGIIHWTHWMYQLQQNLNGDVYSQFLIPPTPFGGNVNNATYGFNEGWNLWPWKLGYENLMTPALIVKNNIGDDASLNHFNAWADILKVFAMHRVSDIYGPIVYSKFGTVDINIPYDNQQVVYNQFLTDLKNAVEILTPYADKGNTSFTDFDKAFGGDLVKWIKAANSLRARLAIRIAQVDPGRAKTEFEDAADHKYGLMESTADNFIVESPDPHVLKTISHDWGDTRMSATMESYLKGYQDPRMEILFRPAAVSGEFKGIRQGIDIASKDTYLNHSSQVGDWFVSNNKIIIMTYSEVCFLKAEAALRGWAVDGTAQVNYEAGVKASFDQWGAGGYDSYIQNETNKPVPFVDPVGNDQNDVTAESGILSQATIKWDAGLSNEKKLEKIMTQKWIALFPDGQEAWSEFRRTGYPRLFPMVINLSGGAVPTGEFVKRLKFSRDEYTTNKSEVDKAIDMIGGEDRYDIQLWWDVNGDEPGNNF